MTNLKIGEVTHFFDKIGVAVIKLDSDLAIGEKIIFRHGDEELFEQEVDSIQVEHEKLEKASKGMSIGLKTPSAVKAGAEVFKVT
jgi:hypothetical protein